MVHTNWQLDPVGAPGGIFVDVDTSSFNFSVTPVYVTSLGGDQGHWYTSGGSSIYLATPKGVYVRRLGDRIALTPDWANERGWFIVTV